MSRKLSIVTSKKLPVVLSLLDSPAYGGAEQYILSNLASLAERGYPICVATNNEKVKEQALLLFESKKIVHCSVIKFPFVLDAIGNWKGLIKFFFWAPFALIWCVNLITNLEKKYGKVICYWAGFSDRLLLSPIAKLKKCPLIWVEIGPLEPTFKKNWGFPKYLYRLVQHLPDRFITTSAWTQKSMVRHQIHNNLISLIYPGIIFPTDNEVKIFRENGRRWRAEQRYTALLISFIGRMASENEVDMLIHGLKLFHDRFHANFQAVLIGDGPEKRRFEALAKRLNLAKNIIFTGFVSQEQKLSMVASSDIFVFSRAWDLDGFGMTTIEAMSVQVPVITSDFGPQQEIVEDGKNGLLFSPHNPESVAEKIYFLVSHKKTATTLAQAGRKSLFPKFTETEMHRLTYEVVRKC